MMCKITDTLVAALASGMANYGFSVLPEQLSVGIDRFRAAGVL